MTVTLGRPLTPDPEVFAELARGVWERARWTNGGPLVTALERSLEETEGWPHAVATASGTAALTAALVSLGLPRGGEVITSPITFRATPLAIEHAGLTPVFAASDPETLCLDPRAVEQAIGSSTVAILPVHLFGVPADPALDDLAAAHALPVVYDAAHAFGLPDIVGRGTLTAYSLHATKLLHTGEGGFVATQSAALRERVRQSANFGIDGGSDSHAGINGKLSEIAAAVGLATLPRLESEIAARAALREAYTAAAERGARARPHVPGRTRALVMEAVRCAPRDQSRIVAEFADRDVIARTFPALCAPGQRYADSPIVGASAQDMAALAQTVIALPLHGEVRPIDVAAISDVLAR